MELALLDLRDDDALLWIGSDYNAVGSFVFVCGVCRLDPNAVRKALGQILDTSTGNDFTLYE